MIGLNNTFRGASPTWANACVGNNGSPDYWTYSNGFSRAANIMILQVLSDEGIHCSVDELIYPVCFNMRHSVELRLKASIFQLQEIANLQKIEFNFDYDGSHDIGKIWLFFLEKSSQVDDRYKSLNDKVNQVILDIAEVDPTGQTFRYPISRESQKHLMDVSVINFCILYNSFKELESNFELIRKLGSFLITEYHLGSFTARLSRCQIWNIAKQLPSKSDWKDESFKQTREGLKSLYEVSNRELSRSINLIKGHYEFAPEINESVPLLGVDEDDLICFLDECVAIHEIRGDSEEIRIIRSSELGGNFDKMIEYSKLITTAYRKLESLLTPEFVSGLKALFYFARELDFSEIYISIYNQHREIATQAEKRQADEFKNNFLHLLKKANSVENILLSLYFLKKIDLAEKVVQRYELDNKYSWLNKARSFERFEKPEYTGYTSNIYN